MPKGVRKVTEPIDFELVPRFKMGEMIQQLTAQVQECQELAGTAAPTNTKELTELALQIHNLKAKLQDLGAGKIRDAAFPDAFTAEQMSETATAAIKVIEDQALPGDWEKTFAITGELFGSSPEQQD